MFQTGQIDLTIIGRLMRENPNLIRKVNFKDGEHQLLNIAISSMKQPDNYGNDLTVSCKPKDAPIDNKWYIGKLKTWPEKGNSASAPSSPQASVPSAEAEGNNSLPF